MGIIFAFAQAFCWASTSIVLRSLATELNPFLVNGLRAAVGMLVIIPLVWITGGLGDYQYITTSQVVCLVGSVILGGVIGDALYINSLKILSVGRAFPIANSYPLFTVLFSALLLDEQITWKLILGLTLTLLGIYFIGRPRNHAEEMGTTSIPLAQMIQGLLLALGTAAMWGITTVLLAFGLRDINSVVATSIRVPAVIVVSLLLAAKSGHLSEIRDIKPRTLRLLFLAGILGWGLAGTLYATAVKLAGPNKAAIIGATAPLFACPLSAIFLKERPTRYTLIGTALTIGGVILII
ncbi:MAG: DMT family transporter [Chloroflexota bacterium]|nr:DMT family transporter [Chloroflexota bacterium]